MKTTGIDAERKVGLQKDVGVVSAPAAAKLDRAAVAQAFTAVVVDMMTTNGAAIPANVRSLPRSLAAKDDQGMRVLGLKKVQDGVRVGVLYASDAADSAWVGRSTSQMLDVQYWIEAATKDGLIKPVSDAWRGLIEVGTFWLDAVSAGHKSRKGLVAADDQQAAGLAILDAKADHYDPDCRKTVSAMQAFPGLKSWSADEAERLGALLSGTGGGVDVEKLIASPAEAVARLRARTGAPLKFLDNPSERRAFAEALLILKLADRSRGQARAAVEAGQDLCKHGLYNGATVAFFRKAVTGG
ncbi:MAG: hypothetical protein HY903_07640 [Deltaproteobacteria bacterium]|nr:hypothetical protein [Deltaproteobacteria bacterium]